MIKDDRLLRIGVLGCGPIAEFAHFDACRKARNATLHAICDVADDLRERMAAVHRPHVAYRDYDAMLADPVVEAVIVAIADQFHVPACLKAIEAGKHVLVEKPLSTWPGFAYNSSMIRIQLDDDTRDELQRLRRQDLPAKARDRLEMVLLSDAGWSPPASPPTSATTTAPSAERPQRLPRPGPRRPVPRRPGPPPTSPAATASPASSRPARPGPDLDLAQLAEALRADGIALGPRQVRRYLRGMKAGYRRTATPSSTSRTPPRPSGPRRSWTTSKKGPRPGG